MQLPPLEDEDPLLEDGAPEEAPPDDEPGSLPLEDDEPAPEDPLDELRPEPPVRPLSASSSIVGSSLLHAAAEATTARQPRARTLETKRGAKLGIPVG